MSLAQLQEIPPRNMILLVGLPGSGKSTFCQQAILRNIETRPIIYVTTEAAPSKVVDSLRKLGLGAALPHTLGFVDAFHETVGLSTADRPDTAKASSEDLTSLGIAISKMMESMDEKALLIFDSLTTPYLMSGSEILRFMRTTLLRLAAEGDAVLACVDEGCGKEEDLTAMMSTADGIIKIELMDDSKTFHVMKHPEVRPTRIEVAAEPERVGLETRVIDPIVLKEAFQAMMRGDENFARKEVGDFVNLFWPNFAHWSGILWDPKRFPTMTYEVNKDDFFGMCKLSKEDEAIGRIFLPWPARLLLRFMPKSFSKVKDMKKLMKRAERFPGGPKQERSGIVEYLEEVSKTDEHYLRIYESYECWGFENIGATMGFYLAPLVAGMIKGFESWQGLERDWNAIETKCIGLGDPYCEYKFVPGEINELKDSLEKDSAVLERINDRLMSHLMGFLLEGKPLVESRERLGSAVSLHPVWHAMGGENITAMGVAWSERYRLAFRMGGAKAGKEVGERLIDAGLSEDEAVKRILHLLNHCKVGMVTVNETIRMRESCECLWTKGYKRDFYKWNEPLCFFTTGFLNGFFSTVKNQHVKETKCIGLGDPYCEWEFR
jgi:predicted hydrocarbon binding protein/KaiC/GvpD/RAD55 family RecA-like ATPase